MKLTILFYNLSINKSETLAIEYMAFERIIIPSELFILGEH
jgi:hypothetical protein